MVFAKVGSPEKLEIIKEKDSINKKKSNKRSKRKTIKELFDGLFKKDKE